MAAPTPADPCTLSNHDKIRVTHIDFEFDIDFASKALHGYGRYVAAVLEGGVQQLVLDTRDVVVKDASLCTDGGEQPLPFSFGTAHKAYGTPLIISLPEPLPVGAEVEVGLHWSTTDRCSAAQFLEASQTAGGGHPYLFTQCQAIHARSLAPCMDTPGAKFTYNAVLRVPCALTGLMSALAVEDITQQWQPRSHLGQAKDQCKCYFFRQPVPIPSYLLALAVGELESRELGPRSRVWSEPCMVEAAAWEYGKETAAFLDAGESLAGEYVWTRYDLLVLPPSFPYGGMENPCLTFMTPTTIAGDRSQTRVVAHEISHSWFGNLVTNASWEHFWLNEGWTVYLERRILGQLYGEQTLQFNAAGGKVGMSDAIELFGADHPFTALVPDLTVDGGVDPDDAFSRIPYEKGFHFLYHLQSLVGGPEAFTPFMRAYVKAFRFKTVDSAQFKEFVLAHYGQLPAVQALDWDKWLYAPGYPPADNSYDESLAATPYAIAQQWHDADPTGSDGGTPPNASPEDLKDFTPEQVIAFLERLGQLRATAKVPLSPATCRKLGELYQLDGRRNTEMRTAWYKLCLEAGDASVLPLVSAFLKEQGRMKYLRPLYRALLASEAGRQLALSTYQEARPTYHPVAAKMVAADLGLK